MSPPPQLTKDCAKVLIIFPFFFQNSQSKIINATHANSLNQAYSLDDLYKACNECDKVANRSAEPEINYSYESESLQVQNVQIFTIFLANISLKT